MARGGDSDAQPTLLRMDLPLVAAAPRECLGPSAAVVRAAVGALPVAEALYAPSVKYLMLVLEGGDDATRRALLALDPSMGELQAAHADGRLTGIIVTMQGGVGGWLAGWLAGLQVKTRRGAAAVASAGDGREHDFLSRFFAPWAGIAEVRALAGAASVASCRHRCRTHAYLPTLPTPRLGCMQDPVTGSAHAVLGPYWAKRLGRSDGLRARQCSARGGELLVSVDEARQRVEVAGEAAIVVRGTLLL